MQDNVSTLADEVKGMPSNVCSLTNDLGGLTRSVTGITANISKTAGNIGNVTQDMQRLGAQVKADNLNLQDTLVDKVQGVFKEFRSDLVKVSQEEDPSSENTEQDSPTPKNVRHASSTQFQTTTQPSRTVRIQADEPNVTTIMQDMLEASNNRFDKLVETLQGNHTSVRADGPQRKPSPC